MILSHIKIERKMIITNGDYDNVETASLPPSYDELSVIAYEPSLQRPVPRAVHSTPSEPQPLALRRSLRVVASTPDMQVNAQRCRAARASIGNHLSVPISSGGSSGHRSSVSDGSSPPSPIPRHFHPVIYTFSQSSFNTMVLSADPNESPVQYHVSVQMNCFIPSSYITVVRRGAEDGEMIGSFEMGISTKRSTITMDGWEQLTETVLRRQKGKHKDLWEWTFHQNPRLHLSWHCDSPVKYCYMSQKVGKDEATLLASFSPLPPAPRADGQPSAQAALKIFPEGQRYADIVVMSCLILERKRMTPDSDKHVRPLFT